MTADDVRWPVGAATGVGSLPGADPVEAARLVAGELPDLPHLPELPQRGPGADIVGRSAAMLPDLHVDLQPSGWRFVARAGVDERRATDALTWDLDALEGVLAAFSGMVKVQLAGPWTLAAGVELSRGDAAVFDPGAVRDVTESLGEAVAGHVADIRRRVPGATVVVQLDEPSLPAVRAGHVRSASGLGALTPVDDGLLVQRLESVIRAAGAPVGVHCCAGSVPWPLLVRAGAAFVSFDLSLLRTSDYDAVSAAIDGGVRLFAGVLPAIGTEPGTGQRTGAPPRSVADDAAPLRTLWRDLSFPPDRLAAGVVVTPECGLAGASPGWVRYVLTRCREIGRSLLEAPEGVA